MNQVPEKTISWSVTLHSKNVYSYGNLTAKIEPMLDKNKFMIDITSVNSFIEKRKKTHLFKILSFFFFRDGTTDVTRTFHFGEPTPYQKVSVGPSIISCHNSNLEFPCSTII